MAKPSTKTKRAPKPKRSASSRTKVKSAALGKTPWAIDVYFYLESVADPQNPRFRIETCLPGTNKRIIFRNRRRPGFDITFHFEDETGGRYQFPALANDAVWSRLGNTCPGTAAQEVFQNIRFVGGALVVHNPNVAPRLGEFRYSLRVTNGGAPILLDPGGDNQNGQTS